MALHRFGAHSPPQPAASWRWHSIGTDGAKPLVTREQAVDLTLAVGSPSFPWLIVEAGHGAELRWVQVFGDSDSLKLELSKGFDSVFRLTDLSVPPTDVLLTAHEAVDVMFRWLAARDLPDEYGLAEVEDDDRPRRSR
jgi:hypothetical protein